MFRSSFRLPIQLLGIPIRLDTSFLLILPLFAWLIGSQISGYAELLTALGIAIDASTLERGATPFVLGFIAALGLFASVLVHELGHAVTARWYGAEVKEITLWFLGGVAQFEEIPNRRGAEAVIAVAGPITSFLLALGFGLVVVSAGLGPAFLIVLSYLAFTNVFLALFNLLPALPLDGGRILRSLLALAMPRARATQVAGAVSRTVAVLLAIYGVLSLQIFILIVAFFIYNAVRAETQYAAIEEMLGPLMVRDLMTKHVITVDPDMQLEQFSKLLFFQPHKGYPVVDDLERVLGFALVQDANEEEQPEGATVASILRPADLIGATDPAKNALTQLAKSEVGRLVVVDTANRVVGILSRTDVLHQLQERSTMAA